MDQNNQNPLPQQVSHNETQPNFVTPSQARPRSNFLVMSLLSLTMLGLGLGGGYLLFSNNAGQNPQESSEVTHVSPTTALQSSTPTVGIDSTWKEYTIATLQIHFNLPPQLSSLGVLQEREVPGDKGSQLLLTFSNSKSGNLFYMGTTTPDYEQGRGGQFIDYQGYKAENGKFFARFVGNKYTDVSKYNPELITNSNGIKILKLKGYRSENEGPSILGENSVGALINTNNSKYPGFAIYMQMTEELTEQVFDQILDSFRY